MSGSTSREVRQRQYDKVQGALREREEALAARGTDASSMGRDPMLRKLKAGLRQARSRLDAIDALQEQLRKAAEEKKARTREAKPKKNRKTEGAEQPAPEKKAKGEKKDKKDKKNDTK